MSYSQDDEAKEAIRVAENVMQTYSMEQALEAEFDPSLQERLAGRLSSRLEADGTIDSVLGQTMAAVSDNDGTEVPEEDWQGPTGYSKFDDEEMYAVSPQDKQAAVQYKLTRQELANLVPQVRCCACAAHKTPPHLPAGSSTLCVTKNSQPASQPYSSSSL